MRDAGSVVRTYTIAVLPGDGIGPEVIAQAERALEAAGERFGIEFTLRRFPLGAAGGGAAGGAFPGQTPGGGGRGAGGVLRGRERSRPYALRRPPSVSALLVYKE